MYLIRRVRYLLCALVCMALCIIAKYKQRCDSKQKWHGNVVNVKYCHSVRFLNRFGKLFIYRVLYHKCLSLLDVL